MLTKYAQEWVDIEMQGLDVAMREYMRLREINEELLAALEFIVNDAPPMEDARLTVEGYNRACAAIAKAKGNAQ